MKFSTAMTVVSTMRCTPSQK